MATTVEITADIPPALDRELPIRIAVLAEGAILPVGNSADAAWEAYKDGKSGIEKHLYPPYTESREKGLDPQIQATTAGTIKDFDPKKFLVETGVMPYAEVMNRMGTYAQYGLAAGFEAMSKVRSTNGNALLIPRLKPDGTREKGRQWIINEDLIHPMLFSTFVGTGFGGGDVSAKVSRMLDNGEYPGVEMMSSLADLAAAYFTQATGAQGGAEADVAACASSGRAMVNAIKAILGGFSELAMVIGTEGILGTPIASAMFDGLGTLDQGTDPLKVSRSLHKDRRGFTIAEGAVAFVLSDPDWAKCNRIPILYEIIGFGETSGAGHSTNPNRIAQEKAGKLARRRAERQGPIGGKIIVSGHFTGTSLGEPSEMLATQNTLHDMQNRTMIYASKRLAGHTLGAAGNVSMFVAGRALQEGVVPGMVFDGEVMPEADGWDIPRDTRPEPELTHAKVDQFGFGDANVSFMIRKV